MRRLDPLQLSILGSEPGQDANEAFISFRLKRRIKDPETPRNAPEVRSEACCSAMYATRTQSVAWGPGCCRRYSRYCMKARRLDPPTPRHAPEVGRGAGRGLPGWG